MALYIQYATVRGRGEFPLDMLRYDRCSPESETDSYNIAKTFSNPLDRWEIQVVRKVTSKSDKWTVARWQSFGVEIIPSDLRTYKVG